MATRKKHSALLVYNLLVKEVTLLNKNLPDSEKLLYNERLIFISKEVFPRYKKTPRYKIKTKQLRSFIKRKIKKRPKSNIDNVKLIDETEYQEIRYYEVEEFIENINKNIYIKFYTKNLGETDIIKTKPFDYVISGVKEITDEINRYCRAEKIVSSDTPVFNGEIQVRPGKVDNNKKDSYYLLMILSVYGVADGEFKEIKSRPQKKKTKEDPEAERQRRVKQKIKEKARDSEFGKSEHKILKRVVAKKIKKTKLDLRGIYSLIKDGVITKQQYEKTKNKRVSSIKKIITDKFKDKKINSRQKTELLNKITNGFK